MDGRLKRNIKLLDLDKFKLAVEDIEQKRNTDRDCSLYNDWYLESFENKYCIVFPKLSKHDYILVFASLQPAQFLVQFIF